jgi:MarR family
MAEVSPIRTFDEEEALAWLRTQPDGRTSLRPAELARRWGWTRQRTSRRLSTWAKDGFVKRRGKTIMAADNASPNAVRKGETKVRQRVDHAPDLHGSVTPIVTAPVSAPGAALVPSVVTPPVTQSIIDVLAYTTAIGLAGVAAYFSIRGMTVLFPGAPTAIVVMGIAMEGGKLATVAWLARHWRASSWTVRNVLAILILTIAAINAAGVYSQLIAAHLGEHTAAVAAVDVQTSALDARVEMQAHAVSDLDARVAQIDAAIAEATKRGRTASALNIIEGQRKARGELVSERQREANTLTSLRTERATVAAKGKTVASEAAPIQYVAAIFGVTDPEVAIRWLVLLMTLACDPLAISLTAAASARRRDMTP